MYLAYLTILGFIIACNCVLLFIFYKHTQKNITTLSLTVLLILLILWHVPKLITNGFHVSGMLFEMLSRLAALGYIFSPVAILVFVLSFALLNNVFKKLSFWLLLLTPPLVFLFLSWTTNLVGVHEYSQATLHPWGYETPTGLLWPIYILWYDTLILTTIAVLIRYYRTGLDKAKREQTLFFIIAIAIPFVITTISVGILPIFGIFVFPFGLIIVNLMSILGIALIYRYGWFEVNEKTILSSINYAIFTVDTNGSILQVNQYAERLLRTNTLKLKNTSLDKVLYVKKHKHQNKNYCMALIKNVLMKGKSMTYDSLAVLINKNQQLFQTISVTPIYSQNSIVGASVFLRDVTKEKHREKQKEDYFSMLSHEIKNPITSIKMYNQLLMNKKVEPKDEKILITKVDTQVDKVTRLINDFVELSRLHNGKFKLERDVIEVDALVYDLIETMKITFKRRTFRINGHTSSLIYADRDRLEQVLINFITNAHKFSPEDKEIIIHLTSKGSSIVVGVQDFGRGIEKKYHKKIFEHYFQIEKKHHARQGMGIGLYISSEIIKAHNGKIWVDSTPGVGSIFCFSLPKVNQ